MKTKLLLFGVIIMASFNAFPWGKAGHKMIANGAFNMLSKEKQKKLLHILGAADLSASNSGRSVANPVTIDDACVWMDGVRHYFTDWKYMDNWHFYNEDKVLPHDNVVYALDKAIRELQGGALTAKDTKMNFLLLLHLVGDIHQPLHCGYEKDRGGNSVKLLCADCKVKETDLHHVWDDEFFYFKGTSLETIKPLVKNYTSDTLANPKAWRDETFALVKERKNYPSGASVDNVADLKKEYLEQYNPQVNSQIAKATVRLYHLLNKLL